MKQANELIGEISMPTWNEFSWAVFCLWAISKGDKDYLDLMRDKPFLEKFRWNPKICKDEEIKNKIIGFLNKWRCRIPENALESIKKEISDLQSDLKVLRGLEIEEVQFRPRIENAVENCYVAIKRIDRFGPTATSKLLHILLPEFFVMWDNEILKGYNQLNPKILDSGEGYCLFLKEMNMMANEVIREFNKALLIHPAKPRQTAAEYLSEKLEYDPSKTMARYLDEYNWLRFTHKLQLPPKWHP